MSASPLHPCLHLYADGGVIRQNPSPIGGTFAFRILDADERAVIVEDAQVYPTDETTPLISNNVTEMLAVVAALKHLDPHADVHIFSDSMITLGRLFLGWKWTGIPAWLHRRYQAERQRLPRFHLYRHTLLDGHPTQAHLAAGVGKRGHPVSRHNAWCDYACGKAAKVYLAENVTHLSVTDVTQN